MPEDQAGTAMVREQGLSEPQPPATLAPAGLPFPSSGAPSAPCLYLSPLLSPRWPAPPSQRSLATCGVTFPPFLFPPR